MVELRALHLTDFEDEFDKLEVVRQYIEKKKGSTENIDCVLVTGDWIHGHMGMVPIPKGIAFTGEPNRTASQVTEALDKAGGLHDLSEMEIFVEQQGGLENLGVDKLDENGKKQWASLEGKIKSHQPEVESIIKKQYQRHAEWVRQTGCPVYGIMGNHDLTIGYDTLEKAGVTFIEKQKGTTKIKGRSGVEFSVQGDLNTWETPGFWSLLSPLLQDYFIPYESGQSLDAMEIKPDNIWEYFDQERKRLGGTPQPVDIYLTHRSPRCKEARKGKVAGSDCSDTTRDFSKGATVIYSGHFHGGQIGLEGFRDDSPMEKGLKGLRTLKDRLEEARGKGDVIDVYGETAAVLYLDEKEPWELNPGNEYFMVTEFNTAKNVEQVLIYEFTYD